MKLIEKKESGILKRKKPLNKKPLYIEYTGVAKWKYMK